VNRVDRAVDALRAGGLVAFPTETVYGLGADAANPDALRRLYAVKGRPVDHPVIVHVAERSRLDVVGLDVPPVAHELAAALWPGPLTLVVRRDPRAVALEATGGLETVGVRVPDHPLALELLRGFGGGIAAPSANRFGRVSPTTAAAVRADLHDDVDVILDGGPCAVGVESTIVDCTGPPTVLRVGGVTLERLAGVLGMTPPVGGTTRAPGTLERHYAPDARVEVVTGKTVAGRARALLDEGRTVAMLAPSGLGQDVDPAVVRLAAPSGPAEYAHLLYATLRDADARAIEVVLAVPPPPEGLGLAVADRLHRAAAASR
jgi:L-threonylcarbamoyladenylate synthase